jgi:methionyl-tRNA synthetase
MSKSRGTLISASALASAIDPETLRYFIFAMLGDGLDDVDITPASLRDRVNSELVGKIANIGSRCAALLGRIDGGTLSPKLADDVRFDACIDSIGEARHLLRERRYAAACRQLVAIAEDTNRWLDELAPWRLALGDESQRADAQAILTQGLLSFRAIMIALAPVTPRLSARALDYFEGLCAPLAGTYADLDIRAQLSGMRVRAIHDLIRRISDEQLAQIFSHANPAASPIA